MPALCVARASGATAADVARRRIPAPAGINRRIAGLQSEGIATPAPSGGCTGTGNLRQILPGMPRQRDVDIEILAPVGIK